MLLRRLSFGARLEVEHNRSLYVFPRSHFHHWLRLTAVPSHVQMPCFGHIGLLGAFMRLGYLPAIVAAGCLVTACAKRPDAIVPVAIPMAAYSNQSCQGLASEYIREQQTLASLSSQQNSAATGDAFGVFLVGVPMSSTFGGDKEGQVAVSKGKVQAIEQSMQARGCNVPAAPAPSKTAATKYRR